MYSPKIQDDLIPEIYRDAKRKCIPMTVWVDQVLRREVTSVQEQTKTEENMINGGKMKTSEKALPELTSIGKEIQ